MEDDVVKPVIGTFGTSRLMCGYHLNGAKSAVQRFSGILNEDIPLSLKRLYAMPEKASVVQK